MATYYDELLLDICVICGKGFMIDISEKERICQACHCIERFDNEENEPEFIFLRIQ